MRDRKAADKARSIIIDIARRRQSPGTGSLVSRERTARVRWPDLNAVFGDLPFAIVGGVATRLYMPERNTVDIDVAVLAADAARADQSLRKAGYAFQGPLTISGSSWKAPNQVPLDLIGLLEPWGPAALSAARQNLDGQGLPIMPLPCLVIMKMRSARGVDVGDVGRMLGLAGPDEVARVRDMITSLDPDLLDDMESLLAMGRLEMGSGPGAPPDPLTG